MTTRERLARWLCGVVGHARPEMAARIAGEGLWEVRGDCARCGEAIVLGRVWVDLPEREDEDTDVEEGEEGVRARVH